MRSKVQLIAAVATIAAGLALGGAASAGDPPPLGPCVGLPDLERARCGTIRVPLDRANPSLGTTQVAFAYLPRADTSRPSLGTLVPNPGGPGVSVISSSQSSYTTSLAPLLDRRDLLLVDPRGTGRSAALACAALNGTAPAFASGEQMLARIGACGRELSSRIGAYTTAAVADDIEAVRAALGLERLDLWGDSYGTFLMPVYAARHPTHVQSIVLNGAGPIAFDPWRRDHLRAAVRGIRVVCARTRACNGEAVLRDIARLAALLRERPVSFTFGVRGEQFRGRLDEGALAQIVFTGGDSSAFGRIPGAVASALAGDFAPLARLGANHTRWLAAIFGDSSFSPAQNFAISCHDYPRVFAYADTPAARRAQYERALDAMAPREFWPFSADGWVNAGQAGAACLEWPNDPTAGPVLPAAARFPNVPVLVLSGELDANSPSVDGRKAAAQFARATFIEIPNAGHTPAAQSACARRLALRFVAMHRADASACAGTGRPPRVSGPAPRAAKDLPLIAANGTPAERRTLGLVVVTAADLLDQAGIVEAFGEASGLRGGRYIARPNGTIRLVGVRVVRDATVSGILAESRDGAIVATMRITGPGVLNGQVRVRLSEAAGSRMTGRLGGRRVDFAFRL